MTKLTLALTLTMMHKCYSVCRSTIDENNDSVSKSWIVFRHGIVAKLTSSAEFSAAEDLANPIPSFLLTTPPYLFKL